MAAYYNEIDRKAAAWLRELIRRNLIAPGEVDERSIVDVRSQDLLGFAQCHFFAGIGVWSYALRSAGWSDDREVWTGSCPCQPFSAAGKRGGTSDERHLWPEFYRLIGERRPRVVFGEQVASKDGLAWLDAVWSDMEGAGYAFGAADTCAAGFGAPHIRQRLYFVGERVGDSESSAGEIPVHQRGPQQDRVESGGAGRPLPTSGFWRAADWLPCIDGKARPVEPGTFPLAHGSAERVGRLRGYGNGLVAPQAAGFIEAFMTR